MAQRRYTRKERLEVLWRRHYYVAGKTANVESEGAASWYHQEMSALIWALGVTEAAIRLGSIGQLERLAKSIREGRIADASFDGRKRWLHLVSGGSYRALGVVAVQSSHPIVEGDHLVIYESEEDGALYARPVDEFMDGRFLETERDAPST